MVSMVLLCATVTATSAAPFEAPANRKAAEILPAELLRGPNYQVRDTVVSYGYMHHWTVDTDFGKGPAMNIYAVREGQRKTFGADPDVLAIWRDRIDYNTRVA